MRNRNPLSSRLLLVGIGLAAWGLLLGACAGATEAPTDAAADQDDAGSPSKSVSIALESADVESLKAAGQDIAIVREAKDGGSEDPVLWAVVKPTRSTAISWTDGDPISLYVTETRVEPGAKLTMLAATNAAPGQSFAFEADGTWYPRGETPSGSLLQLSVEPNAPATGAGIAAPYSVNGVASGSQPATWSPVEGGTTLELGLSNTVAVFPIAAEVMAGTIVGSEVSNPLTLDMEQQDSVDVTYNPGGGRFVRAG